VFAEGVASGDPGPDSVLLWTRVSAGNVAAAVPLTVEVAEDPAFERVVAEQPTRAPGAADHTCRVLAGGLTPGRTYWYRLVDGEGRGSRVGRTRTAPAADDPSPVTFAFVSCQNVCEGRRTLRSEEPTSRAEAGGLSSPDFPELVPEEAVRILDAGAPRSTTRCATRASPGS
jgi:phosphodiesterase/alkaline phosphatase D-like protein